MISEQDANLARDKYSEELRKLGAHAILVDKIKVKGANTFAVIVYVEKNAGTIPRNLSVTIKGKEHLVPVKVLESEKFKLE